MLCTGISLRTEDCVRGSSYVWVNTVYKTTVLLFCMGVKFGISLQLHVHLKGIKEEFRRCILSNEKFMLSVVKGEISERL